MSTLFKRFPWRNISLLLLGLTIALLLSELLARAIIPGRMHIQFMPDPEVGFRHVPGQKVFWANQAREYGVWFSTNSFGDPDVERAVGKPAGVYRIAVVGDSMVEGAQVRLEERFTTLLEDRLNDWLATQGLPFERVEVLNFGIMRYSTAQEWLYYRSHIRQFKPDLVVLVFFPDNDIKNNSYELEVVQSGRPEISPFFELDGQGALQLRSNQFFQNAEAEYGGLNHIYRWVRDRSRLVQLIDQVRSSLALQINPGEQEANLAAYNIQAQQTQTWQQAWELTEGILSAFASEVQADQAAFHMVISSGPLAVNEGTRNFYLSEGVDITDYDWTLPNRLTEQMAARLEIPHTNLLPAALSATEREGQLIHFVEDGHFTPQGHILVADELFPVMKPYLENAALQGGGEGGINR